MQKAFFLDRDGTLNVDFNFVHTPEKWEWCTDAVQALEWIQNQGFKIIVVTNQSGIARGRYAEEDVQQLHHWVDNQLKEKGIQIDQWLYAPHHPVHDPDLQYEPADRKPSTGMFQKAAKAHDIDFSQSFMAGDKVTDLQPAVELGIHPLFITSRHQEKQDMQWITTHADGPYDTLWQAICDQFTMQ